MQAEQTLPESAPVVIIGGGIIGMSTLYHLAHRGVQAVLIERRKMASGTTWHAAGIVGQLRDSNAQTELGKYTARLFRDLEEETGHATGYKQNGTINIALSELRHEQLLRQHDHAARMGVPSHMLSPQEVQDYWPGLVIDDVRSGFFVPSNGQVNPLDVTVALSKGARQKGAQIFEDITVEHLDIHAGKIRAVLTDKGAIATDKVLLAGGMWSHLFAKAHGMTLPLHAAEHFYIVTEPIKDLPSDQPILNNIEERNYWKEDAGKLLIGGFEAYGKAWGQNGIPDDFEFDELPFDMAHVEADLARMFERMPLLGEIGIRTFFCGPESFTPDGRPYMGPVPEVEGMYLAAGMNSNGILNSGGAGLTMAEWIIHAMPTRSVGSMLAMRAHPFQANTRYNRDRAAESVGFHYGLAWAGRQVVSARAVRQLPLHIQLKERGAVMAERIGWEVPMYFDEANPDWPDTPSLRWKPWSSQVKQECLAARDAAVVLDQSMYTKILVQGPDAGKALNHICGADIEVAIGQSVYTPFLNAKGGIEADVMVIRLATQQFMVISGHPSQIRDQHWIKAHADESWQFEIFDATSAYGLLSIHGPKARDILSTLTDEDVSNKAFGFGSAKYMDIGYARGWVIRRSFLGEVGFEIMVPSEFTAGVYDAILATGKPLGLRHMGMFAMNACRLEKGFRHFGHDMAEDDTPLEAGLGFAVSLDKAINFLGKTALKKQKSEEGPFYKYRSLCVMVTGLTAEEGPYLIHNEPIWKEDKIVGHITSGDWGFRIEAMVGLAVLEKETGVSDNWIEEGGFSVQIAGRLYPAEIQPHPFYDPTGAIMRG